MGKKEQKIGAIKRYISNVAGDWSSYSYGNIPKEKARNACSSYAGAVQPQQILGLIDISVTQNGKKGIIFTENRAYYDNGLFGERGYVSYKSVNENGTIPGGIFGASYNKQALKELISILSQIEGQNLQNSIDDFKLWFV